MGNLCHHFYRLLWKRKHKYDTIFLVYSLVYRLVYGLVCGLAYNLVDNQRNPKKENRNETFYTIEKYRVRDIYVLGSANHREK